MRALLKEQWPNGEHNSAMLLVQALDEALFDHTVDSFKAPALNLHTSILEFSAIAHKISRGVMREGALRPIKEELVYRLSNDPILDVQSPILASFVELLRSQGASIEEMSRAAKLVEQYLSKNYWHAILDAAEQCLTRKILPSRVIAVAHALICEAEVERFSRSFLFFRVDRIYAAEASTNGEDSIGALLRELRESKEKKYSVIFRGSSAFRAYRGIAAEFGVDVLEALVSVPNGLIADHGFLRKDRHLPLFLKIDDIDAKDVHSARRRATHVVQILSNIASFVDRRRNIYWSSKCSVESNGGACIVDAPLSKTKLRAETSISHGIGLDALVAFVADDQVSSREDERILNALELHRAALKSENADTQLITLWAGIEALTDAPSDRDRIVHFSECLLPCLTLTYPGKLIEALAENFGDDPEFQKDIENCAYGNNDIEKIAAIVVLPEFEPTRSKIYGRLNLNPLLRYRLSHLSSTFSTNVDIRDALETHRRRVNWHLQRIYATRNQIIHEGRHLPYLGTLVENLHAYFDTMIRCVAKTALTAEYKRSIREIFELLALQERAWMLELKSKKVQLTTDNYLPLLFGPFNSLSPVELSRDGGFRLKPSAEAS